MKSAVIVFPGSNCDRDIRDALAAVSDNEPIMVWHQDRTLPEVDLVALPGGFSYGDYLRCGAMAAHSPIMWEVIAHANKGGYVLGICNGFQLLTECGLLPGALMRNEHLKFVCKTLPLRVENSDTAYTDNFDAGEVIQVPVAHHDGNYIADTRTLEDLESQNQIIFRYADERGNTTQEANPNGSVHNIAGIVNQRRNVLGMMPHPERCADPALGRADGKRMFESLVASFG